jgi:flagellin
MSSILTNSGAMTALQSLKMTNSSLEDTQAMISTGKEVGSAKDDAAVWAISKTMEADVAGFDQISDSISLGEATLSVASQAAESITDILIQIQEKVIAAQGENVDSATIQADIDAFIAQIDSTVAAAQFNGQNLLDGSGDMNVLSSLNRDQNGAVTTGSINVAEQNLSTGGYTSKAVFAAATTAGVSTAGDVAATTLASGDATGVILDLDDTVALVEGDSISVQIGDKTATFTVSADAAALTGQTQADFVAAGIKTAVDALGIEGLQVDFATAVGLTFKDDGTGDLANDLNIVSQFDSAGSGGLGALAAIDVTSDPVAALAAMTALIDTAINAAASFGSDAGRLEMQSEFVSNLSDTMELGISAMVDADMEEASALLSALQVQQELGVEALSIANEAPETLMSLFR